MGYAIGLCTRHQHANPTDTEQPFWELLFKAATLSKCLYLKDVFLLIVYLLFSKCTIETSICVL